jgi:uncharacterized protein
MRSIPIQEFDPRAVARGTKEAVYLDITTTPAGLPVRQTALIVAGNAPGPTLVVSGGVHGDEYEGPLAVTRLYHELKPADMQGTVVGIVVANVPAFDAATRNSRLDGRNLAREFPGNPHGSVTQQIAYWMGQRLILRADFFIDLHSVGSDNESVQLCGYNMGAGPAAELRRRVAEAFRARVIWAHPTQPPGRSLSFALEHDIPAIYTECPAGRWVSLADSAVYQRGVRNAMRVLGMLEGDLEGEPAEYYWGADWNEEVAICATQSGFFIPDCELYQPVVAGQVLGRVFDLTGAVLEEIRAPVAGFVGVRRLLPTIYAGESAFMLGQTFQEAT